MSKKAFGVAIAILLGLCVGLQAVNVADANPIPWAFNPQMTVTIQSPLNGTICSLPVLVNFTSYGDRQFSVSDNVTEEWARSFFYVIDGQNMRTSGARFETTTTDVNERPYSYCFSGQAYLTDLTDGPHSVTVYYGAVNSISYVGTSQESIYYNPTWQATSNFYVNSKLDASPAPTPVLPEFPTTLAFTFLLITGLTVLVLFWRKPITKT